MQAVASFLADVCIVIYLCFKRIILCLVPRFLLYKDLKGETVLITGGASGVGRLLAIKLAAVGCRVVICDLNDSGSEETVKLIKDCNGEAHFYHCDVANRQQVYRMARRIKDELGSVSILINNAGIVNGKRLLDCPDHLIEKTFQVNVLSHFWTCKAFLPDMIANNHGHIVTIASVLGYTGINALSDYTSSKSALITFHEALYLELKKDGCTGIKTTLICPFHIKTNMFNGIDLRYFPSLEVDYAVEEIIASIRSNEETVVIPRYFNLLLAFKSILPISVNSKLLEMMKASSAMDAFVGNSPERSHKRAQD